MDAKLRMTSHIVTETLGLWLRKQLGVLSLLLGELAAGKLVQQLQERAGALNPLCHSCLYEGGQLRRN